MEYIIIGIILLLLSLYIIFENRNLKIDKYITSSSKIPESFEGAKIVVIADLHNNTFGKNNKKLLKAIDKVAPDFILVAGDMLVGSKTYNHDNALYLLLTLVKKYPIYYSYGNHEQRIMEPGPHHHDEFRDYYHKLLKSGVTFLLNESEEIVREGEKIRITGIVIDKSYFKKGSGMKMTLEYLQDLVGNSEEECYNILIAHNPMYFPSYAEWGADMTVAGHVHGGLIRLPKAGGILSPQYIFFPKYDGGRFEIGDKTMFVSRGLGMHTIKIRMNNPPELMVIQLKRERELNILERH